MQQPSRKLSLYLSFLALLALLCVVGSVATVLYSPLSVGAAEPQYLLRDAGGHLALYAFDGTGPLAEYDIYTRLLPEQDILRLQAGLPVANEAELQQLLEDFGL